MPRYPLPSAFIGIMQIFDAYFLLKNHGVAGGVSMALSLVELIWLIVSVVVIFRVKALMTRMLAGGFVAYYIGSLVYGMFWLPQLGDPLVVPTAVTIAGGVFGMVFAVCSALLTFRIRPAD